MPSINCRTRSTVKWSSTALAVSGWVGVVSLGVIHGPAAGVNTWWLTACTFAIAFTMVAGQWWALPSRNAREEQAAIYAMGMQQGLGCGACPLRPEPGSRERKPLEVVR
jgi:hypothetical protein